MRNGRVQPPDGHTQASHQYKFAKQIRLRSRFPGRDMRLVSDCLTLLTEQFEVGVFDDGFVEVYFQILGTLILSVSTCAFPPGVEQSA